MGRVFRPLEPLRGWRRLAVHTWRPPRDPSVYAVVDIPMAPALAYIERLRRRRASRSPSPTWSRGAWRSRSVQFPQLNGIVARGRIMLRDTVDIFLQVATEGGRDLSGIKISRPTRRRVVEIAREMDERVERSAPAAISRSSARSRCSTAIPLPLLGPLMRTISYLIYDLDLDLTRFGIVKDEFGSAMVTNVGTFGLTPALAPLVPFSRTPLVVLVGKVEERPVAEDGRVVVRPMMTLGVTFDHRFMDGYQGGTMAQLFARYLETRRTSRAQASPS